MTNRFFEPLKRIPQKIQNIGFVQKFQDKIFRPDEAIQAFNSASYGMVSQPTCFDFDPYLSLLAIASKEGCIKVYGGKGVSFTIDFDDSHIPNCIKFIPNEGRLIVASQDNFLQLFSLDSKTGKWIKTYSCLSTNKPNEYLTTMCYHNGIIYTGFDTGCVYQFPTKDGKICIGTEEQYLICFEKALKEMSFDSRDELNLDTTIVSLEVDQTGNRLLIGNQGGSVVIAQIRAEITQEKVVKNGESERKPSQSANPAKLERSESSLMRKSKTMTMNLKNSFYGENKIKELIFEPFKIAIPPVPVVSHFFSFSNEVKLTSASWQFSKEDSTQKIVASFDDGSFRVWIYKDLEGDVEVEQVKNPDSHNFPYGPMPCNTMEKILHSTTKNGEDLRIFSGGLGKTIKNEPSLTIFKNTNQFGYGFASRIVDFMLVPEGVLEAFDEKDKKSVSMLNHSPAHLFVLTEKEFYVIDLLSENCKVIENPYLACVDFSPITSVAFVEDVDEKLILCLVESNGLFTKEETKSVHEWPITGGVTEAEKKHFTKNNILFLGHEDGSVSLWQLENGDCMRSLGVFFLSDLYNTTQEIVNDSWPFFKKVGMSQLYERVEPISQEIEATCHAVKSLEILRGEGINLKVVIGSENGHVSIWETNMSKMSKFEPDISLCTFDLFEKTDQIVDNTPKPLAPREGVFSPSSIASKIMQPTKMLQMTPVSPINKIIVSEEWNTMAISTNYGFAVINYSSNKLVSSYFTPKMIEETKAHEMNGHANGNAPLTKQQSTVSLKGKNLKTTLRTSFKKIKKSEKTAKVEATVDEEVVEEKIVPEKAVNGSNGTNGHTEDVEKVEKTNGHDESQTTICEEETKKEEAAEEVIDSKMNLSPPHISWTITSLLFTEGRMVSQEKSSPILIAGTGYGNLLIFDIEKLVMDGVEQKEGMVLCKELHLQHAAPVVDIFMLDQKTHTPIQLRTIEAMKVKMEEIVQEVQAEKKEAKEEEKVSDESAKKETEKEETKEEQEEKKTEEKVVVETKKEKTVVIDYSQDLVVVSEEQIKIFNFPSLIPKQKYKFIDRSGKAMTMNLKQAALNGTPSKTQLADENKQQALDHEIENMCLKKRILAASIKIVSIGEDSSNKFSYIALNLADGNVAVHSLPHLRRQAKIQSQNYGNPGLVSTCSSLQETSSYTCFSVNGSSNSNIVATEIVRDKHQFKPIQIGVIKLPEWSRPNLATVITDAIGESVSKTINEVNEQVIKPLEETTDKAKDKIVSQVESEVKDINDFVDSKIKSGKKLLNDVCNEMNDSVSKTNGHSIGDITMDTVKEYIQSDGIVSVKTSEVTMEKRTTIRDGDISTTLRETELINGEIVKDDITKLKSTSPINESEQIASN